MNTNRMGIVHDCNSCNSDCHSVEKMRADLAFATEDLNDSRAVLAMTVARLGGMVDGRPTARINFLQRIDELVKKERAGAECESELNRALDAADEALAAKDAALRAGGPEQPTMATERMLSALALAAIPLETLRATECDDAGRALAADLKRAIVEAVDAIRVVVADPSASALTRAARQREAVVTAARAILRREPVRKDQMTGGYVFIPQAIDYGAAVQLFEAVQALPPQGEPVTDGGNDE